MTVYTSKKESGKDNMKAGATKVVWYYSIIAHSQTGQHVARDGGPYAKKENAMNTFNNVKKHVENAHGLIESERFFSVNAPIEDKTIEDIVSKNETL